VKIKENIMYIHELHQVNQEVIEAFQRLIPQLSSRSKSPSYEDLLAMAEADGTFVFLARRGDKEMEIVGSATLATFQTPTGVHGWIEDVVVDEAARKQGIGRALTQACIDKAREIGLKDVNLTSRPGRAAANRLYKAMGFVQRETNVYRYALN
jgi:ribosomal protein S18 acetylase RimI-like enzyme